MVCTKDTPSERLTMAQVVEILGTSHVDVVLYTTENASFVYGFMGL
jgi:hypothetical protein